jgi:H+/Cl- antiporter ClcA
MLLLFTPVIGAGATLGISVTMRVTSILGDGLAFLLGMASLKMSPPPVQNHR